MTKRPRKAKGRECSAKDFDGEKEEDLVQAQSFLSASY
jgi:hypothetical protein